MAPDQRSVERAVGGDGAGQRVGALAGREAQHDQILEDDAGNRHPQRTVGVRRRQVEHAAVAEVDHRQARRRVERDQVVVGGVEEARRRAAVRLPLPPHQAALRRAVEARVVAPQLRAGGGVEGECDEPRRQAVQHPVDDERARVHGGVAPPQCAGVVGPGDFEAGDVPARDLLQRRVVPAAGVAEIDGPVAVLGLGRRSGQREQNQQDGGLAGCVSHFAKYVVPETSCATVPRGAKRSFGRGARCYSGRRATLRSGPDRGRRSRRKAIRRRGAGAPSDT